MPKVWGQEPRFIVYAGQFGYQGFASIYATGYASDGAKVGIRTNAYPTEAAALRAIEALWRKTFGGVG